MTDKKAPPREFWITEERYVDTDPVKGVISIHVIEFSAYESMRERAEHSEKLLIERNQNAVLAVENYNRINKLRNEAIERAEKAKKRIEKLRAALEFISKQSCHSKMTLDEAFQVESTITKHAYHALSLDDKMRGEK